jgi:hypothetical protein
MVNQASPVITWAAPAAIVYGTALSATQLNASANMQGSFTYSPAAGTILHAESQTLQAIFTPSDTTDFHPVTATVSITVTPANPVLTWPAPAAIVYGTALSSSQLNATASTAGTFSYSPAIGTILTAGSQKLSVTFSPSDGVDFTSVSAQAQLQVNQAQPILQFATPGPIAVNLPISAAGLAFTAINPVTKASVAGAATWMPSLSASFSSPEINK